MRSGSPITGKFTAWPWVSSMSLSQERCDSTESTDRPMSLVLRLSNSDLALEKAPSSVVHTGVKSLGWENRIPHESPSHSWKLIVPSVVSAVKSGAMSPKRTAMVSSCVFVSRWRWFVTIAEECTGALRQLSTGWVDFRGSPGWAGRSGRMGPCITAGEVRRAIGVLPVGEAVWKTVDISREGPVIVVTIFRPERRNAVDSATAAALLSAFAAFDEDDSASVAVLTGAGGTFCAGADLKALADGDRRPVTEDGPGPMGPTRLDLSKPVIAAIEGHAVAGGLELALWCDLRVAATDAVLGVYCRRFGVPLVDGGTVRLPRLIGQSHALDLVLTGRGVGGPEALGMGLVNRLAPPGRALEAAMALASELAAFPQTCMRNDRRSVLWQWGLSEPDALVLEARFGLHTIDSGETELGAGALRLGRGAPRQRRSRTTARGRAGELGPRRRPVRFRRAHAGPRRGRRLRLRRDAHPGRERVEVPDRTVRARRRRLGRDQVAAQAGARRAVRRRRGRRGQRGPVRPHAGGPTGERRGPARRRRSAWPTTAGAAAPRSGPGSTGTGARAIAS